MPFVQASARPPTAGRPSPPPVPSALPALPAMLEAPPGALPRHPAEAPLPVPVAAAPLSPPAPPTPVGTRSPKGTELCFLEPARPEHHSLNLSTYRVDRPETP